MLFLVDGYNVTMRDPEVSALSKEGQRDVLVARLGTSGKAILGTGAIVVVFDARGNLGASSETVGAVKVVYAADADDEIVRRASAVKGQVTVVTDDMRLRARLSQDVGRHAAFRDAAVCFQAVKPAGRAGRPQVAREDEGLPRGAKDITAELSELWLDEDNEGRSR